MELRRAEVTSYMVEDIKVGTWKGVGRKSPKYVHMECLQVSLD